MAFTGSNAVTTGSQAAGTGVGVLVAGPAGAALGNALGTLAGNVLNALGIGGGPSRWANAGPGVHEWFTAYGPQAFLDWMAAQHPDGFGSVDKVKGFYAAWAYGYNKSIVNPDAPDYFSATATPAVYEAMGIDYPATVAAIYRLSAGFTGAGSTPGAIVMRVNQGTPTVPRPAVDQIQAILDKQAAGAPLTPSERQVLANMNGGRGANQAGMGLGVVALLILIWIGSR